MGTVKNRPNQERIVYGPNVSKTQGYAANSPK